ncbi:2-C-methyl-D-erythritol 2,4-cyclodiphosphate synthase [Cycloclasticus pugetii]|uniref:2-C-methyl-D-erythritol 2,4-cyclodiphosphate synthase n=1 Tax=Cycloclasticus pugetii TaxID=34068 RepID=UPI0009138979|nr:2-C-methyl-D-erythritol 2,4-cyclodiphosphate synthase [Cycloclasticus pugetii]SHJ35399.1 2-C-methyl-D-erythritol 2,4-cyclodiphosphate synthase [Cycloclasticus pugetii]|tara:strand:- start:530 stop:1006 length:477 start_codon:yes stop_codon:yes gene_type:complete
MRIGHGYDAHRFEAGKPLVLGGVKISHDYGLLAHSDGDVLLHALCDALLGSIGEGDIGQHFPDSSDDYANIDSRVLLRHVYALVQQKGFKLGNTDLTIIAQAPKLSPYLNKMALYIARDLNSDASQINIKATTTEGMGFAGRKEGIEAHAVVIVVSAR